MFGARNRLSLPPAHEARPTSFSALNSVVSLSRRDLLKLSALAAAMGFDVSANAAQQSPITTNVKGSFVIVGGGPIAKTGIPEYFENLADGGTAIVPTANANPLGNAHSYWEGSEDSDLSVFHAKDRATADDPGFARQLRSKKKMWLSCGDQERIVDTYYGTKTHDEMMAFVDNGGVVGGTSAGASAFSRWMLYKDKIIDGLGLLPTAIIDQHFDTRNRVERVLKALEQYRDCIGVGIAESTAFVIHQNVVSVLGKGNVKIYTSLTDRENPKPQILTAGKTLKYDSMFTEAIAQAGGG